MNRFDMLEELKKALAVDELLDEIVRVMSDTEAIESLEYIARMHGVDLEEEYE